MSKKIATNPSSSAPVDYLHHLRQEEKLVLLEDLQFQGDSNIVFSTALHLLFQNWLQEHYLVQKNIIKEKKTMYSIIVYIDLKVIFWVALKELY